MFNYDLTKTCAFTGHRNLPEEVKGDVIEAIKNAIDNGYNTFLCGMAIGFDIIAAEAVIELKERGYDIKLIACIPCKNQDRYFSAGWKSRYNEVLAGCDGEEILSEFYFNGCMQVRDRFMVDNSSLIIGYIRKNEGGAYYTLTYAAKQGKRIVAL